MGFLGGPPPPQGGEIGRRPLRGGSVRLGIRSPKIRLGRDLTAGVQASRDLARCGVRLCYRQPPGKKIQKASGAGFKGRVLFRLGPWLLGRFRRSSFPQPRSYLP